LDSLNIDEQLTPCYYKKFDFYIYNLRSLQFLFIVLFASVLISFYFSYFTSSVREENLVDADYLAASGTVEAEKEISSLDDVLLGLVVVIYVFG